MVVVVVVVVVAAVAFRQNSAAAAAAAVVVVGLSIVVPGVTAGTGASVAGLLMLGTRLACVDSMGMTFGHVERQMKVAVGKG